MWKERSWRGITDTIPWRQSTVLGTSSVRNACDLTSSSPSLQIMIGRPWNIEMKLWISRLRKETCKICFVAKVFSITLSKVVNTVNDLPGVQSPAEEHSCISKMRKVGKKFNYMIFHSKWNLFDIIHFQSNWHSQGVTKVCDHDMK